MAMQQTLEAVRKYYESVDSIIGKLITFQNSMSAMLYKLNMSRGKFVFEWENYQYSWESSGASQLSVMINSERKVFPTSCSQAGQCQFMAIDYVYKLACNLKAFHRALVEQAFTIYYKELSDSCEAIKQSAVADLI